MDDTELHRGLGEDRLDRLWKARQTIDTGNEDIFNATILQFNGLITNDKFCFVRDIHLSLSRSRVPFCCRM